MNKKVVINHISEILNNRLQSLKSEFSKIQESANNESKSSMGDKYETGRAMAQNEIEKLSSSIKETENQIVTLSKIDHSTSVKAVFGSLVETSTCYFFLSIGLGELKINNQIIYGISPLSPIGKQLLGKQKGENFLWMGKSVEVLEIN